MDTQVILESIAGPAGAVVSLAAFSYAAWNFLTQKVWPLAVTWIQNQNSHMEALIKSHEEDRKSHADDREVFQQAMLHISARQASIDSSLDSIKTDISQVREIVQIKKIYKAQLDEVAL
jgi:hypothetical protein